MYNDDINYYLLVVWNQNNITCAFGLLLLQKVLYTYILSNVNSTIYSTLC